MPSTSTPNVQHALAAYPALRMFFAAHLDAGWRERYDHWREAARDFLFQQDTATVQAVLRELTALNHLSAPDAELETLLRVGLQCHADFAADGGPNNWVRWVVILVRDHLGDELSKQAFEQRSPAGPLH
jgi:hypothetical protein